VTNIAVFEEHKRAAQKTIMVFGFKQSVFTQYIRGLIKLKDATVFDVLAKVKLYLNKDETKKWKPTLLIFVGIFHNHVCLSDMYYSLAAFGS
jgi:hypothetical protein